MEALSQHSYIIAVTIARVFLGFLFFFQGFDAVFKIKIKNVIATYSAPFADKGIPGFLTTSGAWFTSYAGLIGGLLLIPGLFEYGALCVLGIDMIIASVAFGMVRPMWDMQFVFPRLALLLFLLATPPAWHAWSFDALLFSNN